MDNLLVVMAFLLIMVGGSALDSPNQAIPFMVTLAGGLLMAFEVWRWKNGRF